MPDSHLGHSDTDTALRARIRSEVISELQNLVRDAGRVQGGDGHIIVLSDYEVANLREAIWAAGYASTYDSPLTVLNNGDWLGMIWQKLSQLAVEQKPNETAESMARRASKWVPR